MISEEKLNKFREKLISCERPLFLFDDDPDGLSSFLILYKMVQCGTGWPIKGAIIDVNLAKKVINYAPDLIVVLDKAEIDQDFIDEVKIPIIWLDHHKPVKRERIFYINPQIDDLGDDVATSYWAYKISKKDEWISAVGIISDWQMLPKDLDKIFRKTYPELLPKNVKDPKKALFDSPMGVLSKIFSFNLKGKTDQVLSSVKILSRISDPFELLEGKNPQTKLVLKRYNAHKESYEKILDSIQITDDKIILFKYFGNENSYTTDLANELLNNYPDKIIIVARESNNSFKCSLRSGKIRIDTILEKVLSGMNASGGGHPHACGAVVPSEQFDTFVQHFREELH